MHLLLKSPQAAVLGSLCASLMTASAVHAQDAFTDRFVGEAGVAAYATASPIKSRDTSLTALPYVYGDWGRAFARVDTLGVKALPMGMGHLEGVVRVSQEGWDADTTALRGLKNRSKPLPVARQASQEAAYL